MKVDKSIRAMPWQEPYHGGNQDFAVTLTWRVVDHERLMVATFTANVSKRRYIALGPDFRIVCSKKRQDVAVIFKGEKRSRTMSLSRAMRNFGTAPTYCYPEISEQDEINLAKWLGRQKGDSLNHFMHELDAWTIDAVQASEQARADERGELRDEDVYLCPDELPDGLVEYIRRVPLQEDRILLYKKGNVRGTCFQCRRQVHADLQRFRQHEIVKCPNCGAKVQCILEGSNSFKADYVEDIITIQRGKDGDTVFLRQWHIVRDYTARWENIPTQLDEIARYAVRGNCVAKWQREAKVSYYMNCYRCRLDDWKRYKSVTEVYDGQYYFFLPDNWKDILSGTSLKYCDLSGYIKQKKYNNPVRFLIDWVRYPAIEKFWKAGYIGLVQDRIRGYRPGPEKKETIRWKQDSIRSALRFPARLMKMYRPEEWSTEAMAKTVTVWGLVCDGRIREQEVEAIVKSAADLEDIKDALGHAPIQKIVRYIDKQAERESDSSRSNKSALSKTYRDYLTDCVKLGLNLDDSDVLFPANLEAAHARTIAQVRYKASEKSRAAFAEKVKKLSKLTWKHDGLLIRAPADAEELIYEGAFLHHCVGGYVNRVAKGETAILFIRREQEPDVPFFTLEWCNGHVVQCRTMHNRSYVSDEQVRDFVEAWVNRVTKKLKAEAAA